MGGAVTVEEAREPAPAVVDALVALYDAVDREIAPGDPPHHPVQVAGWHFGFLADHPYRTWVAWRDGQPAGWARSQVSETGENPTVAELELEVAPAHRGAGVGRALAAAALEGLREDGRSSVMTWSRDPRGDRFAQQLGLTRRQDERCSRLLVADLDVAQQQAWIDAPRARAAGYRVVTWGEEGCPDDLVAAWCTALEGMDDAPLDDLEWVPEHITGEQAREREAMRRRRGDGWRISLALDASGAPAGVTELFVSTHRPQVCEQGDTAVLAGHRGHGLGRWLKAANLAAARQAWPQLAVVETYNAETNPWMLDINVAMGFRPHMTYRCRQGPIDAALRALAASPVPSR
jgi:mycothiol synthase